MNFTSRFALGQVVEHNSVLYKVYAIKFAENMVSYDLLHSNNTILAEVDSMDVNPVEGN